MHLLSNIWQSFAAKRESKSLKLPANSWSNLYIKFAIQQLWKKKFCKKQKKKKNEAKLDKSRKTWYVRYFWLLLTKIRLKRVHWALGCVCFWDLPNISNLKLVGSSWSNSYVIYTRYHVPFYLRRMKAELKHSKLQEYYDQNCRYQAPFCRFKDCTLLR